MTSQSVTQLSYRDRRPEIVFQRVGVELILSDTLSATKTFKTWCVNSGRGGRRRGEDYLWTAWALAAQRVFAQASQSTANMSGRGSGMADNAPPTTKSCNSVGGNGDCLVLSRSCCQTGVCAWGKPGEGVCGSVRRLVHGRPHECAHTTRRHRHAIWQLFTPLSSPIHISLAASGAPPLILSRAPSLIICRAPPHILCRAPPFILCPSLHSPPSPSLTLCPHPLYLNDVASTTLCYGGHTW